MCLLPIFHVIIFTGNFFMFTMSSKIVNATEAEMCECGNQCMDLKTPRNVYLTAFYKRSFAYITVRNRMPVIITQLIDGLARNKEYFGKEYGEEGQADLKFVIGELSKLKYEIQTNKPMRNISNNLDDFYNAYLAGLKDKDGNVTYFNAIWLVSECYMYRRIREAFELSNTLHNYDPFRSQKKTAFKGALPVINRMGEHLLNVLDRSQVPSKEELITLMKLNLWGNKCDLSFSNGAENSNTDHLFNLDSLDDFVLSDQSEKVWDHLSNGSMGDSRTIDIIFDNSGYELFTDLCLADYLISTRLADKIRFHVKSIPWFISDVMSPDFKWTLAQLKDNESETLNKLWERWNTYMVEKQWQVHEDEFWTYPVDYSQMSVYRPKLYTFLAKANLLIFKGDLNYRKLFGEKNWDPVTPLEEALQGFNPAPLVTLRTIKADIVCGLEPGVAEMAEAISENWMTTGDFGLIQFCDKVVALDELR